MRNINTNYVLKGGEEQCAWAGTWAAAMQAKLVLYLEPRGDVKPLLPLFGIE